MTAVYGMQGHAKRGAAPGGAGQVGGGIIGSIAYDRVAPDSTYLLAAGGSVLAADYPEFAAAINLPPIFNVKLPAPATIPTGTTYYTIGTSGQNIMSDNGEWFALPVDANASGTAVLLYRVVNGVATKVFQFNIAGGNYFNSSGFIAVSNNGDFAVATPYNSTVTIYRNNGDNTWSMVGGFPTSTPSNLVWTRDSQYLIYTSTVAPYVGGWKMPVAPATNGTAAAVTMNPAASSPIIAWSGMNRNAAGDRWVIVSTGTNLLDVYDFNQGTMTFTKVAGSPTGADFYNKPSFSPDGLTLMATGTPGGGTFSFDIWAETQRGAGFKRVVNHQAFAATSSYGAWLFGGAGDSYACNHYASAGSFEVWALNGLATIKVYQGDLVPGQATSFGTVISRDGTALLTGNSTSAENCQLYRLGSPPPSIPLPAVLPQGYGPAKLYPFVKVRS